MGSTPEAQERLRRCLLSPETEAVINCFNNETEQEEVDPGEVSLATKNLRLDFLPCLAFGSSKIGFLCTIGMIPSHRCVIAAGPLVVAFCVRILVQRLGAVAISRRNAVLASSRGIRGYFQYSM